MHRAEQEASGSINIQAVFCRKPRVPCVSA